MKRLVASCLAGILLAVPASGYARQNLPADSRENVMRRYVAQLAAGTIVKVRTREAGSFSGILMVIDQDRIIVKPKTRIPEPERTIAIGDLEMVEPQTAGLTTGKAIAIGVSTGAAAFLGFFLTVVAILGD